MSPDWQVPDGHSVVHEVTWEEKGAMGSAEAAIATGGLCEIQKRRPFWWEPQVRACGWTVIVLLSSKQPTQLYILGSCFPHRCF